MNNKRKFETWKKLEIAKEKDLISCINKLSVDFHISKEAKDAIEHRRAFYDEKKDDNFPKTIDLVKVSITELFSTQRFGYEQYPPPDQWARRPKQLPREKEVLEKARELGLERCPNNTTAPLLRMAYQDQPEGETLIVMSSGFTYIYSYLGDSPFSFGTMRFGLANIKQKLYIIASDVFEKVGYDEKTVFVFAKSS